jgi:hypothetical protein
MSAATRVITMATRPLATQLLKVVLSGRWPTFGDRLGVGVGVGVGVSLPGSLRSWLWQHSTPCLGRYVSLGLREQKILRYKEIARSPIYEKY